MDKVHAQPDHCILPDKNNMHLRSAISGTCAIRIAGIARKALAGKFVKLLLLACETGSFQRLVDHGRHVEWLVNLDVRPLHF